MSSCRNADTRKKHINRLSRIEGQIQAIKKKITEDRPCEELLRLTAAVKGAIGSFGIAILEEHMQGCVSDAMKDKENQQKMIQGAMELFSKFSN
ncbi:CsoR family transcriptional regulator [Desulfobacteraceae bacterium SEEP-SAG9]|nr:CsoR family transcriptional regulator [Desulfobacteraceae bacterium SEEP-SAG9]